MTIRIKTTPAGVLTEDASNEELLEEGSFFSDIAAKFIKAWENKI